MKTLDDSRNMRDRSSGNALALLNIIYLSWGECAGQSKASTEQLHSSMRTRLTAHTRLAHTTTIVTQHEAA